MYPEIRLSASTAIPTYFLVISFTCLLCALWFVRRAEARQLLRSVALDLALVVFIAGFLGARLLHVFFEEPQFYAQNPWAVLQVWNGGFVYLGGVVAAALAALAICQWRGEPFWFWADVATLPIALGYGLGRLGCLLNGCCYGQVCNAWFAIDHRHPTQLYASLWEFTVLAVLWKLEPRFKHSGILFNTWLIAHALGRIVMELFRDDPRGDLIFGASLGIWMSAILCSWAGFNLVLNRGK